MPVVALERMSVATKELKNLAETLKVATAEKAAPESSDATTSAEMQLFLAHFGEEEGQGKEMAHPEVVSRPCPRLSSIATPVRTGQRKRRDSCRPCCMGECSSLPKRCISSAGVIRS